MPASDRRRLPAVMLLGALLTLTGNTAHAKSAGLRLMPVGDSITAGYRSTTGNGYRGPLWNELTSQGEALDFVGSQRGGVMFDPDNEGYYGYRIGQVAGLINKELALYQPNVVLLDLGINDLGQNHQVSTAPQRLAALVDQIIAADPTVTVLVAQLIPNTTAWVESDVVTFNAQLPGIVQARVKAGKHVFLVRMGSLTTADLKDGLHPNDGGYQKMADAWDAGIRQVIAKGWVAPIAFAGVFEIQNVHSGLALDISGGSNANAAAVLQLPYTSDFHQLWSFLPTRNGYDQIENVGSSLDLNVTAASTESGASVVQWPFGSQGNDQWLPVRDKDGSYTFRNRNSGLYLDDPDGSRAPGTPLDQQKGTGRPQQQFWVKNHFGPSREKK